MVVAGLLRAFDRDIMAGVAFALHKKVALGGRSRPTPMSKIVLFVRAVNHSPTRNTLTHW